MEPARLYDRKKIYLLGLDIGSTTIKAVIADPCGCQTLFARYFRHQADIEGALQTLAQDAALLFPHMRVRPLLTGSGALGYAARLGLGFVQEVIAQTVAVRERYPQTDVVIELGGEDAKITYLTPVLEQRMNGTCAGGTGAFLDQMAVLLKTDAQGLNELASRYQVLYPIASRCGVFAKSDLQPLINDGASREDLAASVMQSVVNQTIAGLACGHPIRGQVLFLGGPLYYLSQLRAAFCRTLEGSATAFACPADAQLFVALGAALHARNQAVAPLALGELAQRTRAPKQQAGEVARLAPLFGSQKEKQAFDARHAAPGLPVGAMAQACGPCYLGLDAGSTTTKAVLLDEQGRLLFSHYAGNEGEPVKCALGILRGLYAALPKPAYIARACVTGYGEGLVRAALRLDEGEIETMAHLRAARLFDPQVSYIVDIGGQDMKCLRVHNGALDSIRINEACSSGCGSFLQTFAQTLGLDMPAFTQAALFAPSPVDLGTRCTVFMNSRVKQAQREGAAVGDIAAGLCYAVARNALYKVMKIKSPQELGQHVVAQGGAFLSDALLRAFELIIGQTVTRPPQAGLMGALGAALGARLRAPAGAHSGLLTPQQAQEFVAVTRQGRCGRCENRCRLTVSAFSGGARYIAGNRCERGSGAQAGKPQDLPDVMGYTYRRAFDYVPLDARLAPRGVIGVPRVLNMYQNYPFWHTFFTQLGFSVRLSAASNQQTYLRGMESIPSESVCYPAKLAHGHIMQLMQDGCRVIFYPSAAYERQEFDGANNRFNCPIVASYPEVIANNVPGLQGHDTLLLHPFLDLGDRLQLPRLLTAALAPLGVPRREVERALALAWREDAVFRRDISHAGEEAVLHIRSRGLRGIVLAGRPYHCDPEINHGLPGLINALGLAVLTEASVAHLGHLARPLRVVDQWAYHSRLYEAASYAARQPDLELVQLTSFGCGLDAVTSEQAQEITEAAGKVYTLLKIDEVSNLGAARIRLRSLIAAQAERAQAILRPAGQVYRRVLFTRAMRGYTILAPQMAPLQFALLEGAFARHGYNLKVLAQATPADVAVGLQYVNNDACYPSIMVVGQLVNALKGGAYDMQKTALLITQTGGGCRATNYVGFLRKALADAGLGQVPVIALSASGIEQNPGFTLSFGFLADAVRAICFGDLLQTLVLRTRPYEAQSGAANALCQDWLARFRQWLGPHRARQQVTWPQLVEDCVQAFDALPLRDGPRRPQVGVVGEILVKFQPDANNHLLEVIENEGCEAVMPGLMDFLFYAFYSAAWKMGHYRNRHDLQWLVRLGLRLLEGFRRPMRRALAQCGGKFMLPQRIGILAARARGYLSLGNATGEGWFLLAEMLELLHAGANNIVCAQPFACLPNHVFGKGMIREIRRRNPQANIVAVDYDPGASEANQLNRIKLMLSSALLGDTYRKAPPRFTLRSRLPQVRLVLRRAISQGRAAAL